MGGGDMASAIEDPSKLQGKTVSDQDGLKIGRIKRLYTLGGDESVMWVTIETSLAVGRDREVFVPLARLKHEQGEVRVPYSVQHVQSAPEVEAGEELSENDDRKLRDFYSVDLADRELRTDNESYANQVPEGDGEAQRVKS
jgi:hypothetical protein